MAIVDDEITNSKRISGMGKKLGVSGDGDLQDFFDASNKNQLWYFNNFTTKFPFAGWMKYKPQKLDTIAVGPPTVAQRKVGNWGFTNIPSWTQISKMAAFCSENSTFHTSANAPQCGYFADPGEYWKYDDPKDWASTSYRRAKDFEGAWNFAKPALIGRDEDSDYYHPGGSDSSFTVYYRPFVPHSYPGAGMNDYALEIADFLDASSPFATSMYFGVMFCRNDNGTLRYFYKTMSTPVGRTTEDWWPTVKFSSVNSFGSASPGTVWHIFPFLSSKAYTSAYHASDDSGVYIALPVQEQMSPSTGKFDLFSDAVIILNDGLAITITGTSVSGSVLTVSYDFFTIQVPTAGYYHWVWKIEGQMTALVDEYNQPVSAGQNLSGSGTRPFTFENSTMAQNARMVSVSIQPVPTSGTWLITETTYASYDI